MTGRANEFIPPPPLGPYSPQSTHVLGSQLPTHELEPPTHVLEQPTHVLVIPSPSLKHDLDEEVLLRLPGLFIIALTPMDTPLFGPRPASLTVTYVFSVQFEIRSAQIVR